MMIKFAKMSLQSFLVYRARVIIWAFVDFINFIVFPFIWLAVFGGRTSILGYTHADLVTYYIILAFISLVCSSHIAEKIKPDILRGDLNNYLVKPINYLFIRTIHEASYKILTLFMGAILFVGCLVFIPQYVVIPRSAVRIAFFVVSLVISFCISQLIQFLVGLSSFWLGENSGPDRLRYLCEKIFAGELAPLTFLPPLLRLTAGWLPFQYLSYIPAQIYLGRLTTIETVQQIAYSLLWMGILYAISLYMWQKGSQDYEGVGI